jgi:hypothetical protein
VTFDPQSLTWPSDRAVLLVHGIGDDSTPPSVAANALTEALGGAIDDFAVYELQYDGVNNWFSDKTDIAGQVAKLKNAIAGKVEDDAMAAWVSEFAGDIIWPVLSESARSALRTAFITQLQQMIRDSNRPARDLHISIIAHSLGCFHTFEALHAAATDGTNMLRPSDGVFFDSVVLMASPVQLIRTFAQGAAALVPSIPALALARGGELRSPTQLVDGQRIESVRRFVSVTGDLDPVGGFFFRQKAPWAYMDVRGQEAIVDEQHFTSIRTREDLRTVLLAALRERARPQIQPQSPHDWTAYITRHQEKIRTWLAT